MMRQTRRILFILVAAFASLAAWPTAAERRPITENDLFKFVWIADPQISPDGSQVAFVRVSVDEKKDTVRHGHLDRQRPTAARRRGR